MKKYSRKKLARALPELLAKHPRQAVVKLIAQELIKTHSVHELPWLVREAAAAFSVSTGKLTAQLETARPLSPQAEEQVTDLLKKTTGATTIAWEKKINKEIVGGFIAETPTLEVDASVQSRLNSLIHYAQ